MKRLTLTDFSFAVLSIFALQIGIANPSTAAQPQSIQSVSTTVPNSNTADENEWLGVWEAEQVFSEGELAQFAVHNKPTGELVAKIGDKEVIVSANKGRLSFSMPDHSGQFRGKIDEKTMTLAGFWIQPTTQNLGYPLATPVRFSKTEKGWNANFELFRDRLRLYLNVRKPKGDPLEAFVRNPERNLGIRLGYLFVEPTDKQFSLKQMRGDSVFTGSHFDRNGVRTISLSFPYSEKPFEFRRAVKNERSAFYSSHLETPYVYTPPLAEDDGWEVCPASQQGFDASLLEELVQGIRDTETSELTTPYIHSVLISRRGKLVLEEYFCGYDQKHQHDTRSAGKSVASMLVGAVMDHDVQLNENRTLASIFGDRFQEPYPDRLEPSHKARSQWRRQITIGHALAMQSGLDADDNDGESLGGEDRMQDQSAEQDWQDYILAVPMVREPGSQSVYGSNNINLAAAAIAEAKQQWLPELFEKHIAQPLGIDQYHFNLDPSGNGYMGGGIRLSARDQLKLGQVMLDNGKWKGKQVLSESWVKKSLQPHGSIQEPNDYGYGWWRKSLSAGDKTIEVFHASGNGGQLIVCVPELEIVVQMSGGNYGNFPVWYKNLTELIPEQILATVR